MGADGGGWSNAAIKQVPVPARRAYVWLAVIWASYCGGLHGFNTANISGTMSLKPFLRKNLQLFWMYHLLDAFGKNPY